MTGRYLTDLANVLRAAGLNVTEQEGWQTRARGSGGYGPGLPWCVMWHHAASAPNASTVSVANYASYGSDNAPVCNLVLGRAGDIIVCAAGATNTNGKGGPWTVSRGTVPLDQMNTHAIGVEAVNTGIGEAWPANQIDAYFAIQIACAAAYGFLPADAITHAEYAPGRKIDPATAAAVDGPWQPVATNSSGTWRGDDIRYEALNRATTPTPAPPPTGDHLMFTMFDMLGDTYGGYFDANGIAAQVTWLSPQRTAACTAAGAEHIGVLDPADMANCDLLGPCPAHVPRTTFANVIP